MPKEQEAYRLGEKMFWYRGGSHDFACATCHGDDGKRIRLQDLPNLTTIEGAQKAYTTWPAYRVSQGELRTFQWRLYDCFRQQRFPELEFASDASIALTMFLARNANGATFDAPSIKRWMTCNKKRWMFLAGTATLLVIGCASMPSDTEVSAKATAVLKSSFKARGQAGLDRLDQDATQSACTAAAGKPLPKDVAERIEKENMASIQWPADGKFLGDWRNGERIAQEGRGKQFSDDPKGPVGGNCYACHQLSPQEVSYGTIGPSLLRFGKVRGFNDEIRQVRLRQDLESGRLQRVFQHAAFWPQRNSHAGASPGSRRAVDGPCITRQSIARRADF